MFETIASPLNRQIGTYTKLKNQELGMGNGVEPDGF